MCICKSYLQYTEYGQGKGDNYFSGIDEGLFPKVRKFWNKKIPRNGVR